MPWIHDNRLTGDIAMTPTATKLDTKIYELIERGKHRGIWVTIIGALILWPRVVVSAEPRRDPLNSLASDVWVQFELAYRSQPAEYERRRLQFNAVIEAWRAAPMAPETDERLANWMRGAIHTSMPGSRTPLPPAPQFVAVVGQQKEPSLPPLAGMELIRTQYVQPTITSRPAARPIATAAANPFIEDPFLDDPVSR